MGAFYDLAEAFDQPHMPFARGMCDVRVRAQFVQHNLGPVVPKPTNFYSLHQCDASKSNLLIVASTIEMAKTVKVARYYNDVEHRVQRIDDHQAHGTFTLIVRAIGNWIRACAGHN